MPVSNITLMGYLAALGYLIINIYQYWLKYPDTSQFMMNLAIAVLIGGVAFLYNRSLSQGNTLNQIEEHLADKAERRLK